MKQALIILYVIIGCNNLAVSQVYFTREELLVLADHNTERLYLKDLTTLQQSEIDSLYRKVDLMQQTFELCEKNNETLTTIIAKLEGVDKTRQEQIELLKEDNAKKDKTIKKQEGKIKVWRIVAPISTAAAFIVGLFIK
jgi:hypothetical protein